MSTLQVKILSRLARVPQESSPTTEDALRQAKTSLARLIPNFPHSIRNKVVMDFGSGEGWHALAFGDSGANATFGIEIDSDKLARSRQRAQERHLDHQVFFESNVPDSCVRGCDWILSLDSMEHVDNPAAVLDTMKDCLRPGGQIVISFGPTWFSPYGSHMNYFLPLPWVHLFFKEESIMQVRTLYRNDGARRYAEVPGGLNKMSVRKFEKLVRASGLRVAGMEYHCIRGINWLRKIPVSRELFTSSIICRLEW